jgi:hypothetical protein
VHEGTDVAGRLVVVCSRRTSGYCHATAAAAQPATTRTHHFCHGTPKFLIPFVCVMIVDLIFSIRSQNKLLDTTKVPEARAAIVWTIGEYRFVFIIKLVILFRQ